MKATIQILVLSFLLVAFGCATTPTPVEHRAAPDVKSRIAEINQALESEQDGATLSALLFERGHLNLNNAEQVRDSGRVAEGQQRGLEFSTYILYAIKDFEAVIGEFPDSAQAPEALYHLGVVYDYPNISSFGPALRYYKRTVEEYPGSDSAAYAKMAIKKIEDNVRQVMGGEHGENP